MRAAWEGYRSSLQEFYEVAARPLAAGAKLEPAELARLDPALDSALASSEQIRRAGKRALRTARYHEYDEVAELLLATAAVDAMVAVDVAAVDPGLAEYSSPEGGTPAERAAERGLTLDEVDALFARGPDVIAGAQRDPDPDALRMEVEEAIDELVRLAAGPAGRFGRSIASIGLADLLEVVSFEVGKTFKDALKDMGVGRRALGFVREHALKLIELGVPHAIAETMVEIGTEGIDISGFVGRVARAEDGKAMARREARGAQSLDPGKTADLQTALSLLISRYRGHTKWLGRSARWLGWGSSALASFLPGGFLAVAAVNLAGAAYVGYSVIDRIDARKLHFADRVEGVVRLVRKL